MRDQSDTPRITCRSVQLRLIQPREARSLLRLASEERLSRFLQWSPHQTIDDSLDFIRDTHALWERGTAFLFGIFDATDGDLIGSTGLMHINRADRCGEVGTWIGIPYQGRGYNRDAKAAIFDFGFRALGLHRIEMLVRVDNEQSLAATRRLPGVYDEGVQHMRIWQGDQAFDAGMFAITSTSWATARYPKAQLEGPLP